MKIGVVTFPGTLDDRDAARAIRLAGGEPVSLWHADTKLQKVDAVVLPGGFSYGDYLRCGAIAAQAPVMKEIIKKANEGLPVLGICNGFQILCEAKLLPGALLHNESRKFICKNVYLKPVSKTALPTRALDFEKAYKVPIAHGEGKFFAGDEERKEIIQNDQILFRYCNTDGETTEESNPNGSMLNIAGICNKQRNVFGMMPHPERAADFELENTDGREIFESILQIVNA